MAKYKKVDTDLKFVDSKWKTAYRTRSYPCNQRYDPEIPYNEGLHGST